MILLVICIGLVIPNAAWASYTSHTEYGNWNFNDEIDDFSYVYCDLQLPVDQRVGSLTEVTLKC